MPITWQAEDTTEPIADTTIEGIANFQNYSTVSGCGASYNGATMVVAIAAGSVLHNGSVVTVAGNNVTLVSDATHPRWTWIGISSAGTATIISGTPAAAPTVPELGDYVCSQLVLVQANLTIATNATAKLDKRVIYTPTKTVLTTTGDTLYASGANTVARLGIGSASQVLTVTGGIPAWATASSAGVDNQAFAGSGTWTKPASAGASSRTLVRAWGGGGGGGGGLTAGSGVRSGGGSGGGAPCAEAWFLTSLLGSTETITIATGGAGGAVATDGSAGGNTTFGSWVTSFGGGSGAKGANGGEGAGGGGGGSLSAGANGTTSQGSAGGLPNGNLIIKNLTTSIVCGLGSGGGAGGFNDTVIRIDGGCADFGGGGGGAAPEGAQRAGGAGGSSRWGGGGGGGGGSVNTATTEFAGGAGGASNRGTSGGGGAGGAVSGGAGTAGTTGVGTAWGGTGGGGGGGADFVAGNGGVGGAKGGGGGGGGGARVQAGTGAAGGIGWMEVITFP